MDESPIIEGRSCGSCTLCCKVMRIDELEKPQGAWCRHCQAGRGCTIYEQRPRDCRTFHCGYLTLPAFREHWFPARSKMVVLAEQDGARVAFHVDPGRPNAWREAPYYDEIKRLARLAAQDNRQVVVCILNRVIVVLPDREVDLGLIDQDERIITLERMGRSGPELDAIKLKADDPRIEGLATGRF